MNFKNFYRLDQNTDKNHWEFENVVKWYIFINFENVRKNHLIGLQKSDLKLYESSSCFLMFDKRRSQFDISDVPMHLKW